MPYVDTFDRCRHVRHDQNKKAPACSRHRTRMKGGLRYLSSGDADTQLLHARDESRAFQAETSGGAIRSADLTVDFAKNAHDVIALARCIALHDDRRLRAAVFQLFE